MTISATLRGAILFWEIYGYYYRYAVSFVGLIERLLGNFSHMEETVSWAEGSIFAAASKSI